MRSALALGLVLLCTPRAHADSADAEQFRECMARRQALTEEAMLEEDTHLRAEALAKLPRCVRANTDPIQEAFEECREQRRKDVAEAMALADPHERGEKLARISVCRREENGATTIDDPTVPPPPPPAREPDSPIPWPNALELALSLSAATWSGGDLLPSGTAPLFGGEVGVHWSAASVLAFGAFSSWDGSVTYTRESGGILIPTVFQYHESFWVAGVRGRGHLGRFSLGAGAGYGNRHADGSEAMADFHTNHAIAQFDVDVAVACLVAGRFQFEVLAGGAIATSSSETTTSGRIGIAARL